MKHFSWGSGSAALAQAPFAAPRAKQSGRLAWNWGECATAIGGTFLFTLAVNAFVVPYGLYNGSLLGVSQLLRTLILTLFPVRFGFDIAGLICYLLNIPLLALAYVALSRQTFFKTILICTVQTLCLTLIPVPAHPIVDDTLTGCIIGGLIAGYGCGLVLRSHYNGGGTDVLGLVISKKYASFSVGKLSILINCVIYTICALTQNLETAIYSIIYTVVMCLVLDRVHSQNVCSEALIFCQKDADEDEILHYLVDELHRTATFWDGTGGYSKETVRIIFTVVSQYELRILERHLKHHDLKAFVVKKHHVGIDGQFPKHLL